VDVVGTDLARGCVCFTLLVGFGADDNDAIAAVSSMKKKFEKEAMENED
jgi:hypothetical protein